VGRICFDTIEEYADYAHSVVAAEDASEQVPARMVLFNSLQLPGDGAMRIGRKHLLLPLALQVAGVEYFTSRQFSDLPRRCRRRLRGEQRRVPATTAKVEHAHSRADARVSKVSFGERIDEFSLSRESLQLEVRVAKFVFLSPRYGRSHVQSG
jgi:hypothetical protein